MNASYPENTTDYDEEFVFYLATSVFDMEEMKDFLKSNNQRSFNKTRLSFVKSNQNNTL